MKGGTSGANVERKPSLIKDKGISATSRLVVTTTSASHSLQHPLSEKPSSCPPPLPRVRAPRSLIRHDPPEDTTPDNPVRSDTGQGRGDYIPLCRPCLFTLRVRVRLSTKQAISSSRALGISRVFHSMLFLAILIVFKKASAPIVKTPAGFNSKFDQICVAPCYSIVLTFRLNMIGFVQTSMHIIVFLFFLHCWYDGEKVSHQTFLADVKEYRNLQ